MGYLNDCLYLKWLDDCKWKQTKDNFKGMRCLTGTVGEGVRERWGSWSRPVPLRCIPEQLRLRRGRPSGEGCKCEAFHGSTHWMLLSRTAVTGAFQMSVLERIDWRVSSFFSLHKRLSIEWLAFSTTFVSCSEAPAVLLTRNSNKHFVYRSRFLIKPSFFPSKMYFYEVYRQFHWLARQGKEAVRLMSDGAQI